MNDIECFEMRRQLPHQTKNGHTLRWVFREECATLDDAAGLLDGEDAEGKYRFRRYTPGGDSHVRGGAFGPCAVDKNHRTYFRWAN
jgi:hypothetical protein